MKELKKLTPDFEIRWWGPWVKTLICREI